MARFAYRMQSILDLKYKTEGQARMAFSNALRAVREEEDRLNALYERRARYVEDGKEMRSRSGGGGGLPVMDILMNDDYIARMEDLIEVQKAAVKRAEEALEIEREKLNQEVQERKMQERLRERAFEEYLAEEKAQEAKELDERSSFVYGQGG